MKLFTKTFKIINYQWPDPEFPAYFTMKQKNVKKFVSVVNSMGSFWYFHILDRSVKPFTTVSIFSILGPQQKLNNPLKHLWKQL